MKVKKKNQFHTVIGSSFKKKFFPTHLKYKAKSVDKIALSTILRTCVYLVGLRLSSNWLPWGKNGINNNNNNNNNNNYTQDQ